MKQLFNNILNPSLTDKEKVTLLLQVMNSLPIAVTIIYDGNFSANEAFYQLIGEHNKSFHTLEDYCTQCREDYILYKEFSSAIDSTDSFSKLYTIHLADGKEFYVENCTCAFAVNDKTKYYVTSLIDRTSMNNLSTSLEQNNDRFRILEELMNDYLFEYDIANDTLFFSDRWKPDGIHTEYPHAKKWLELHEIIHPEEMNYVLDILSSTRIYKEKRTVEFRARFIGEEFNWYRLCYKTVRFKKTGTTRFIGTISNIDAERLLSPNHTEEGIDPLTGLLHSSYIQKAADQILSEEPKNNICALMLLQLDHFSSIKKATGDLYTKQIEKQVADKLKTSFRTTDLIGYSNNGCYTIFMRDIPEHIITLRALQVLKAIPEVVVPKLEGSGTVNLSCSIGVALAPLDSDNYMDMFLKADSAMYLSKARNGNTYSYFNSEVDVRQRGGT